MGFLDTKAKAMQYDAANAQNAKMAQDVANMTAAQLAAENAYLKQGLAGQMAVVNTNPYNIANVPGQEVQGYQMPRDVQGVTGQDPRFNQMLLREALARRSGGGLANTLNQDSYRGVR